MRLWLMLLMQKRKLTMKPIIRRVLVIILAAYFLLTASALAQSGGDYDLSWFTIDGGGRTIADGNYRLKGSIGQPDAGPLMSGGNYTLVGGFRPAAYIPAIPIPGDINGDRVVNIEDLAILTVQWLTAGGSPSADLVHDHIVNFFDFAVVAGNWGYDARQNVKAYDFTLDTDPGWTVQGQWAFGYPTGGGGANGNHDPANGFTGSNVFGVNLAGDYSTSPGGPYYLTTGPLNCTGYASVHLKFARWLNTDFPPYVRSKVEVSKNGTEWTTVWEHTSARAITDSLWQNMDYDISSVADNQPAVYIRWSYQVGSDAYAYSGWNIDDIELWGLH